MSYKKNCGFRKINICKFREEDCLPEKCDMYNIAFTAKDILKQAGKEKKTVKLLARQIIDMKLEGKHKTDKERYELLKKDRNDKVYGLLKLSKAYMHCKRLKL